MLRLQSVFHVLIWMLLSATPALGQPSETAVITPHQAREALDTLQDPARRDEVVRTLEILATESEVAVEEETPLSAIVPLEADGLIARTLDQVGDWAAGLRVQLMRVTEALGELPNWFQTTFFNEQGRLLLL